MKYLTIKEVSQAAGVSVQSIYQRLGTTLKDYVKVIKGKKYLEPRVLVEIYGVDLEQEIKQGLKTDSNTDTIKLLQDTLEVLKSQLEQKDRQIEELTKSLQFEQGKTRDLQGKMLLLEDKPIKESKGSWWHRLFS